MSNKWLYLFLLMASIVCSCNRSVRLEDDPDVTAVFDQHEIEGLKLIVQYFDSVMIAKTGEPDAAKAYKKYFEWFADYVYKEGNMDSLWYLVGLEHSEGARNLIRQLKDNGVYHKIWRLEPALQVSRDPNRDFVIIDTIFLTHLVYFRQGKYVQTLAVMAQHNQDIKEYYDNYNELGDINISMIAGMVKLFYKEADFDQESMRLFCAIHYLSDMSYQGYDTEKERDAALLE